MGVAEQAHDVDVILADEVEPSAREALHLSHPQRINLAQLTDSQRTALGAITNDEIAKALSGLGLLVLADEIS